ncbi:MAG: radical SAM protein [Halobacteriovoraceae bacterium]|nr:radical SAM protein [Halobacteriovoraceae bacterium]
MQVNTDQTSMIMKRGQKLIDAHGRHIHKLRMALLDACNFRCVYCMPNNPKFLPANELLSSLEIINLVTALVDLGIDEIRVTGGEPTLRSDFIEILEGLSELPLEKLSFTSNGTFSPGLLKQLENTNCRYINFSLDSLNPIGLKKMTGSSNLETILSRIFLAKEMGLVVKINAVIMRGLNDHEIADFVNFSAEHSIEVRFLELMRIGPARNSFESYFVSASEIIEKLKAFSELKPITLPVDSTSFNFLLDNGANIGIIASESRPFCNSCSRLRLTAKGELRPCLMTNEGISLKNKNICEITDILYKTMSLKPVSRIYDVDQPMNQIGG